MKEYRKARFAELLRVRFGGDRHALCAEAHITNARVSQLLDETQPFGDTAARRLIQRLRLPLGYFDPPATVDNPLKLSKEALHLAAAYDRMTPTERTRLEHLLAAALDVEDPVSDWGQLPLPAPSAS